MAPLLVLSSVTGCPELPCLANVSVTLGGNGADRSTNTNEQGRYEFHHVDPKTSPYHVSASGSGYDSSGQHTVLVQPGKRSDSDIPLVQKPSPTPSAAKQPEGGGDISNCISTHAMFRCRLPYNGIEVQSCQASKRYRCNGIAPWYGSGSGSGKWRVRGGVVETFCASLYV